jgi:hypothetical protein
LSAFPDLLLILNTNSSSSSDRHHFSVSVSINHSIGLITNPPFPPFTLFQRTVAIQYSIFWDGSRLDYLHHLPLPINRRIRHQHHLALKRSFLETFHGVVIGSAIASMVLQTVLLLLLLLFLRQ